MRRVLLTALAALACAAPAAAQKQTAAPPAASGPSVVNRSGAPEDVELADRFVGMWVNQLTLDYTERGRRAVQRLLDLGFERGVIPHRVEAEFVG